MKHSIPVAFAQDLSPACRDRLSNRPEESVVSPQKVSVERGQTSFTVEKRRDFTPNRSKRRFMRLLPPITAPPHRSVLASLLLLFLGLGGVCAGCAPSESTVETRSDADDQGEDDVNVGGVDSDGGVRDTGQSDTSSEPDASQVCEDACGDVDGDDTLEAEDGACGTFAADYYREDWDWPQGDSFCDLGTLAGDIPTFPDTASSVTWTCAGSGGGQSAQCTATRSDECSEGRQPPSGWTQLVNCLLYDDGECDKFSSIWDGGPFWEVTGNTKRMLQNRYAPKQYLAIEIDLDGMPPSESGRFSKVTEAHNFLTPKYITSISRCPGDFHRDAILEETGCYQPWSTFTQNHVFWGGPDSGEDCQLEPGGTYYWNLIASDSDPGTAPDELELHPNCAGDDYCGAVISTY